MSFCKFCLDEKIPLLMFYFEVLNAFNERLHSLLCIYIHKGAEIA